MKISRWKKNTYPLFIICLLYYLVLPLNYEAQADIGPERQVVIEQADEEPVWKMKWDVVRELVRQQKYREAALGYGELLSMKSNIEEARWEYLQLLMRLNEWDLASNLVASLIEQNPHSMEYRLSGGEIALVREEFERAAKHFGWAFTRSPNSSHGLTALQGLIDALQGQGKHDKVLFLIEQLYVRKPHDPDLLRELATIARQQGKMSKAAHYFSILIDQFPVDARIIFQAATLYDQMGKKGKAALYWKDYLDKHPEYLPFQKKISDYYLSIQKQSLALPHLLVLLKKGERSDALLLQIGELYLHDRKRPDQALIFLEEYFLKNPDNKVVQDEIAEIRTVLANDLISIVENNGAWRLWKDLAQLTPDRLAIYLSMVDVLKSLDKEEELYEILTIIYQQDPGNQKALLGLAEIELRRNRVRVSVGYFNQVTQTSINENEYFFVKANIEDHLGNELSALTNFEHYLRCNPADREVLIRCLELSGRLGLVSHLKTHFQALKNTIDDNSQLLEIEKKYVTLLRINHFFNESEKIHNDLIKKIGDDPVKTTELLFARADYLYGQGLVFEAEQLVRRVLISNFKTKDALVKLVELSIGAGEIERGWSWFSLLRGQATFYSANDVNLSNHDAEVTLLQAKLLSSQDKDDESISLLKKILFTQAQISEKQNEKVSKDPALLLIRMYMKKGLHESGLKLAQKVVSQYPQELEAQALLNRLHSIRSGKEIMSGLDCSFSQLVLLAQYALKHGGLQNGLHLIEEALRRVKSSVWARVVKAQLLRKDGQYGEAQAIFQDLIAEFPANQYFERNLLEIQLIRGNATQIVKKHSKYLSLKGEGENERRGFIAQRKMILARAFAKVERYVEALDIYSSMIITPVEEILVQRIKEANILVHLPASEKSLWDIITFSKPEKIDFTETVMAPDFVGKHLGKHVDIVTTELYDEYRWQKLIRAEKARVLAQLYKGAYREREQPREVAISDGLPIFTY